MHVLPGGIRQYVGYIDCSEFPKPYPDAQKSIKRSKLEEAIQKQF